MPPLPPAPVALQACVACPRLAETLAALRLAEPDWHNAPVAPWGPDDASLLILGLAPGRRGANRTGRPFSGDASGDWVQQALRARGLLRGDGDRAELRGVRISNALKCFPPRNRPRAAELHTCRERWLLDELSAGPSTILALGRIAHEAVVRAAGEPLRANAFSHAGLLELTLRAGRKITVVDCFHPSPLNTRTGRMDRTSFDAAFDRACRSAGLPSKGGALTVPGAV